MRPFVLLVALAVASAGAPTGTANAQAAPTQAPPAAPRWLADRPVFDVRAFGATGGGTAPDTRAIQAAIDSAGARGGAVVVLSGGTFLSGTLHLRSGVELRIEAGATLLGSPNRLDYTRAADPVPIDDPAVTTFRPDYRRSGVLSLILAENVTDVAITGGGTVDGQGLAVARDTRRLLAEGVLVDPEWAAARPAEINRPMLLLVTRSRRVRVADATFRNAANWVMNFGDSEDVAVDGVRVESTTYWNNDGIQISDSRRVRVAHSFVNAADDGICFKSSYAGGVTEDVVVENNTVRSSASALKFGTSSNGIFRNIRISNLRVYDTFRSAIALEIVDGGLMEDITVDGVDARNTGNALFIRLGDRNPDREPGRLRRILVRNVRVEVPLGPPDEGYPFPGPLLAERHNLIPASITGLPGHPVESVTLENVEIVVAGGGQTWRANAPLDSLAAVPERAASYPEFSMFGELPAWGLYVRHVDGLTLRNVRLKLQAPDYRPAVVADDVRGLTVDGLAVPMPAAQASVPLVVLKDTDGASLARVDAPVAREALRTQGRATRLVSRGL